MLDKHTVQAIIRNIKNESNPGKLRLILSEMGLELIRKINKIERLEKEIQKLSLDNLTNEGQKLKQYNGN